MTVTDIAPRNGNKADAWFDATYLGVIVDATDSDTYKIHAPSATTAGPMNLNVLV